MHCKDLVKMSDYGRRRSECRMATSGQRVRASSQTDKLSPGGKGIQRSTWTSYHGLSGITVGLSVSTLGLSAVCLQQTDKGYKPWPLSPLAAQCLATILFL